MIDVSLPAFPHMFTCSLTRAYWFHQSNELHVLNVSFRTKVSTSFLKTVLLKVVGINVIIFVSRFSIMPALILNLK